MIPDKSYGARYITLHLYRGCSLAGIGKGEEISQLFASKRNDPEPGIKKVRHRRKKSFY